MTLLPARLCAAQPRGALWPTYDQPKLIVAELAARQLTLWSCCMVASARVQELQMSRCVGGVFSIDQLKE